MTSVNMGTQFALMIFTFVILEYVVCQPTTDTANSAFGDDIYEQQQQKVDNQLQSIQKQVRDQSVLIEQLQQNVSRDCGCEPVVRYYNMQFQMLPLVNRRSRDQLVRELQTSCNPLLVQQHVDGSNFFNRTWNEFKDGFNDSNGNYWLGNELLHQLTMNSIYKLRFDLQSLDTSLWFWAEYSTFTVDSEAANYTLQVGGFNGNVYRDAFGGSNGMKFSTKDRDNDTYDTGSCALAYGGFWYYYCALCRLNSNTFCWNYLTSNNSGSLQTSRMWLVCR